MVQTHQLEKRANETTLNTLSHSHLSVKLDNNFMLNSILIEEMLVSILQQKVVGSHLDSCNQVLIRGLPVKSFCFPN